MDEINFGDLVAQLNEKYVLDVEDNLCGDIVQDFGWLGFTYQTDGFTDHIFFNDICVWDSDNDDRNEEEEEPWDYTETIEEYCTRKYEQLIKMLATRI